MSGRVKVAVGALIIGGVIASLWAAYRPLLPSESIVTPRPTPAPPRLYDSRAVVAVRQAGSDVALWAVITCDGRRRSAGGYWKRDPRRACDALAATRGALLGAQGCSSSRTWRVRVRVTGRFGGRRFDHRAQRGGCPDDEGWLAVNVLATPVVPPDQAVESPTQTG
jgi:hypothetical protein